MRIPPALFLASIVLLLHPAIAAAQWRLTAQTDSEPVGPGAAYVRKTIENSSGEDRKRATLHLVTFKSDRMHVKVIDQGPAKPGTYNGLADAMQKNFCVAGCNGGFFHPDFSPSGLVIADGKRFNRFQQAKLLSGVLVVDGKGPRILRRAEFKDHARIDQLLQSGPFLVDRGNAVAGLSTTSARSRTFILNDGKGGWALGLCTAITLADLGTVLADAAILSELRPARALNLDGGSSSSLYFNRGAGNKPFHYRGFARVRNFVGIAPK